MKKIILGNIVTVEEDNKYEEAIVVDNGIIEYVGSKEEALKRKDNGTEIIDYGNNFIYPGFIESHCHGFFAGYRSLGQIDLTNCVDGYNSYGSVIKGYIEKHPGKDCYIAYGWNEIFGEVDHVFLDEIYDKAPLVLNTAGGHSCVLNKVGMEKYHINEELVNRLGSTLVHTYSDGKPTGYICEEAAVDLLNSIEVKFEDAKEYILEWQRIALSKGFTACTDAGVELMYDKTNEVYYELEKENKLKLRTFSFSIVNDNEANAKEAIEKINNIKNKYDGEYFKTIGAKVFLDGVGEARTSWTVNEYKDEKAYYGLKRFSNEERMINLLNEASKHNLSVHAHSEGDGATRFILDCIKKSQAITKDYDQRNLIAHLHFVQKEDFKNMFITNSIPLVAPLWTPAFPGVVEKETVVFGKDMADNTYPIKSFLDEGCRICFHSDYPISPILDVSRSIYMAETRRLLDKEEKILDLSDTSHNINEKISRLDALKAMTINGAYAFKQDHRMGSIKVGKLANFTVLDRDLVNDMLQYIIDSKIIATIIDGEIVYKA